MNDSEFIAFCNAYDSCWMTGHFDGLGQFLANDVVFVAPGGTPRTTGLTPAADSYRQFLSHAKVNRFSSSDHVVTQRGDTAVIEYGWEMTWVASGEEHQDVGHEVLVMARRDAEWRIVWRTQIPKA